MPVGNGERSKMGVERSLGAVNGSWEGVGRGLLLGRMGYKFACFGSRGLAIGTTIAVGLLVQRRANDGDYKMSEV